MHYNLFNISYGATNKIGKAIWYSDKPHPEKLALAQRLIEQMKEIVAQTGYELGYFHIRGEYSQIGSRCIAAGDPEGAAKAFEQNLEYSRLLDEYLASDRCPEYTTNQLKQDIIADWGNSKIQNQVKGTLQWLENSPFCKDLRETPYFAAVMEKYRPYARDV